MTPAPLSDLPGYRLLVYVRSSGRVLVAHPRRVLFCPERKLTGAIGNDLIDANVDGSIAAWGPRGRQYRQAILARADKALAILLPQVERLAGDAIARLELNLAIWFANEVRLGRGPKHMITEPDDPRIAAARRILAEVADAQA